MKWEVFKSYFLTVLCGLVVFIGLIFVMLQYQEESTFSFYGNTITVRTIWLVLGVGILSPVFLLAGILLVHGTWIIYKRRRMKTRQQKQHQPSEAS